MKYVLVDRDYLLREIEDVLKYYGIELTDAKVNYLKLQKFLGTNKCFIYTGKPDGLLEDIPENHKEFLRKLNEDERDFSGMGSIFFRYGRIRKIDKKIEQKGVDVLLAIDIVKFLEEDRTESIDLITGDTDFVPVLEYSLFKGKGVEVIGSIKTPIEIKRNCDRFTAIGIYFIFEITDALTDYVPIVFPIDSTGIQTMEMEKNDQIGKRMTQLHSVTFKNNSLIAHRQGWDKLLPFFMRYDNSSYCVLGKHRQLVIDFIREKYGNKLP